MSSDTGTCCDDVGDLSVTYKADLPIEVWTLITSYTFQYPTRLNLVNTCNSLKFVVDYDKSIREVDIAKYATLNSNASIDRQVDYVLNVRKWLIRSLVIPQMTVDRGSLMLAMSTIATGQSHQLNAFRKTVSLPRKNNIEVCQMVSQFTNLCMLEIACDRCPFNSFRVDLTNVTRLKVLKGNSIRFSNCTAGLIELEYNNVKYSSSPDINDLNQMLYAASKTLKVLLLKKVSLFKGVTQSQLKNLECSMLNVRKIHLIENSGIKCTIINIAESNQLADMQVDGYGKQWIQIVGLHAANHCLSRLDARYNNSDIVLDFVLTVTIESFGQMKHLRMHGLPNDILNDLLEKLSVCGNFPTLRYLEIISEGTDILNTDKLCKFVACAPNLECIRFSNLEIDKEHLVEMVTCKLNTQTELLLNFGRISNSTYPAFLHNLTDSLLLQGLPKRIGKIIIIDINQYDADDVSDVDELHQTLLDQFNINVVI